MTGGPASLVARFECQVDATPDAIALTTDDGAVTYEELDTAAARCATKLLGLGVERGSVVGVHAARSCEALVGIIAALKAGAAYLPLDPTYPLDRFDFTVRDSRAVAILTSVADSPTVDGVPVVPIDRDDSSTRPLPRDQCATNAHDAAYVIYTSGTTGRPKGVVVENANVTRLFEATDAFDFDARDVWSLFHSLAFDFSVWEMWGALLHGGRLVVVPDEVVTDPDAYVELLRREQVTVLNQTPSAFRMLQTCEAPLESVRLIVLGGEPVDLAAVTRLRPFLPAATIVNMYGITETTVHATWLELTAEHGSWNRPGTPIGSPLPGSSIELLALGSMERVSDGEIGEICVCGPGVARGYLGRPGLTADRFVPHPATGRRMYRSGDLAYLDERGSLVHVGRSDSQVKVRGFRVELGEIEAVAASLLGVEAAVATVSAAGDSLAAFVVPDRLEAGPVRRLAWHRQRSAAAKVADLPNGMSVLHANDGETAFLYDEIFRRESYRRLGIAIPNEGVIVDAGANIGMFSLWAADQAADVTVYAVEPLPPTYELLKANLEVHAVQGAALQVALGAVDEFARFEFFPHDTIFSGRHVGDDERRIVATLIRREQSTISSESIQELLDSRMVTQEFSCRVRPLSEILEEYDIDQVDVLKIDVEKAELEVLAGIAPADWRRIGQVVIEAHDTETAAELAVKLTSHGFSVSSAQDEGLRDTGLVNLFAVRSPARPGRRPDKRFFRGEAMLRASIRTELQAKLLAHAVPSEIAFVDVIPRTVNGKVDLRTLAGSLDIDVPGTPELTLGEQGVAIAMSGALPRPVTHRDAHFFESGGQSLAAVAVIRALRERYGQGLPLQLLFENPRVKDLAAAIDLWLAEQSRNAEHAAPRGVVQPRAATDLAETQRPLWAFQRLYPESTALNVGRLVVADGVSEEEMSTALNTTLREFPLLRTRFSRVGTATRLIVDDFVAAPIASPASPETAWNDAVRRAIDQPFALDREGPVRTLVGSLPRGAALAAIVLHHIAADATSMDIFLRRLATHLQQSPQPRDELAHEAPPATQGTSEHGDRRADDYWARVLAAPPPPLPLPSMRPRRSRPDLSSASVTTRFALPVDFLSRVGSATGIALTSQAMLLSVCAEALQSFCSTDDLAIGIPHEARPSIEAFGCFVEMAPVRIAGNRTRAELISSVCDQLVSILEYGAPSPDVVANAVEGHRPPIGHHPLFQAAFSYHDAPIAQEVELAEGGTMTVTEIRPHELQFDLAVVVQRLSGGVFELRIDYRTESVQHVEAARLADTIAATARRYARAVDAPAPGEHQPTVLEAVEQLAATAPNQAAVEDERGVTTYAALITQSRGVAGALAERGVRRGDIVGVMASRSADLVAAMLGIWKLGAAYLPLDPSHPNEWRSQILTDAAPVAFVVDRAERPKMEGFDTAVVDVAEPGANSFAGNGATPLDLAYVVYTSGSTGTPKGVAVTHANVMNLVRWHIDASALTAHDRVLQTANPVFDAFGWEVWPALSIGATLVLAPDRVKVSPTELARLIRAVHTDVAFVATPVAQAILREKLLHDGDLRLLHTGGDRLDEVPLPNIAVINNYGPTETTVVATSGAVTSGEHPPSIGRPIRGASVYLLDDALQPVPDGAVGEIFIGGSGVALGYHRHPRLTADRFLPDPWASDKGARMYQTGDLAVRSPDGSLSFRGRADDQVSLRGVRIEPAEVEHAVRTHPGVADCAVVLSGDGDSARLVAFVVLRTAEPATADEVLDYCTAILPTHLRPTRLTIVDQLPLTSAGKVDRPTLAEEARIPAALPRSAAADDSAPTLVDLLTDEWRAILNVHADRTTNLFFEGGDSLDAANLAARIAERLGRNIPIDYVFEAPTPTEFERLLLATPHAEP